MFKIGVGPSSSHTLGPWNAVLHFLRSDLTNAEVRDITAAKVKLYGSLAKTGRGHGTDIAVIMGLLGEDPETTDLDLMDARIQDVKAQKKLKIPGGSEISFDPETDIEFVAQTLPYHPNGMIISVQTPHGAREETYYSVGGGFVEKESGPVESLAGEDTEPEFPIQSAGDLIEICTSTRLDHIYAVVLENEKTWRDTRAIERDCRQIWETMRTCIYRGCHTGGLLPGGLSVHRRAMGLTSQFLADADYKTEDEWILAIRSGSWRHAEILRWVSGFALAVNEQNAAFQRIVTAPTNGAAGVIPAVMMYHLCFSEDANERDLIKFLLTAGQVGVLFKKGATISAAQGGCQAEIGVSSAMAAAALTDVLGGSPSQALMAAEIAMEHHLGLTCDPVKGLVQIPCIERNSMGAIKAITAAHLALSSNPGEARVSLDSVIQTMWDIAQDMDDKYKETAEGGLAIRVPLSLPEC